MNSRLATKLTSKLATKVDIFVSCHNLLDMDVFSKSDPLCVMYQFVTNKWVEMGRTEKIQNDLNPQFSTSFKVDFYFEEVQKIRFSIFDIDNDTPQLDDDDYLGSAETTLGEIVSNSPLVLPLFIKNSRAGDGKIILRAVEESGCRDSTLRLQFSGTKLDKKDFLGLSDPYLEFSKTMPDGGTQVVHRTEYISNTLDPVWKEFEVSVSRLCDGYDDDMIKVDCYDYNTLFSANLIGSFNTSLQQLTSAQLKPFEWECINMKKKAKKSSYKNSGIITLNSCKLTPSYTFLDYVFGGLQLKFCVSIDFTASNGDPRDPQSLHHLHPSYHDQHQRVPNHYERAIRSVGQVVKDYDSTQQFPCMGFGARIPPTFNVSHCFNLNSFTSDICYAHGVQGILDNYYNSLSRIQLYGPTNFAPTIQHVAKLASQASLEKNSLTYYVLLIITDGVISDMGHTIQAIISASNLPLSIIIVGVGEADFDAMDRLDSDDRLLRDGASGRVAKRDIVQFVPFKDYERASEDELGRQVLAELPGQVLSFYKMMDIPPGEAKNVSEMLASGTDQLPPQGPHPPSNPYPPHSSMPHLSHSSIPYPSHSSSSSAPYPPPSFNPSLPPQSSTNQQFCPYPPHPTNQPPLPQYQTPCNPPPPYAP